MPMPRLHFVTELPGGSTKRDQELERARARAHAASVSYHSPRRGPSRHQSKANPNTRRLPDDSNVASQQEIACNAVRTARPSPQVSHLPSENGRLTPPWTSPLAQLDPYQSRLGDSTGARAINPLLTPPESLLDDDYLDDVDAEDIENVNLSSTQYGSHETSPSQTMVLSSKGTHNIHQINPHARHNAMFDNAPLFYDISSQAIPHDTFGHRTDPFDMIPRRDAQPLAVSSVIDYHAQIMAPNHAPIYKIFNVTNVYTNYYFELLSHPDFLYTGVASVQAIIDHLRRKPGEPVTASKVVMGHIGTAMSRLRKRMGKEQERSRKSAVRQANDTPTSNETLPVDDMTIMTVLFLAVVTRAVNDIPAHEVHRQSLAALVDARGGLQNIYGHDGLARCTLLQWESFWALNTGVTIFPNFRPPYDPEYPELPIDVVGTLGTKLKGLPVGFQALAVQGRLALDVIEVLVRTAVAHIEQANSPTESIVTPSDVFRTKPRKFQDFWEACTCLSAPDEIYLDEHRKQTQFPNLEKILVLALLLYCLHTFSPMRAVTAVYNGSRMKLGTDLPRRVLRSERSFRSSPRTLFDSLAARAADCKKVDVEAELIQDEEDLLLWAHFNLVDSWRAANDSLLPQGIQIMSGIRARFPDRTGAWSACELRLKRFFWNQHFIARCKMFWNISQMVADAPTRDNG